MDSIPRRWVLRPLSPSLQPSDLRSISAQRDDDVFYTDSISAVSSHYREAHSESSADVMVEARQVSVSQEDGSSSSEELPVSPCSSSSGASHSGFYSFVEDPFSLEAEHNEAWMVSSQRQTKLATLREVDRYKLQSYSSHMRPGSLFQDESTDSQYKIDAKYGYEVVGEQEERQLRREIICNQAPKKSSLVEKDRGSPFGNDTSRLIEGMSISYSHVSSKPNVVIDSGAINEEQINFDAARKQFLQMEQNKLDPIIRPRKSQFKMSPKQDAKLQDREVRREEQVPKPNTKDEIDAKVEEDQSGSSRQSSFLEESDTFLPNLAISYSSDDRLTSYQITPENDANSLSIEHETPIEREIRIAQEREENLRRSRGLQHSVSGEMVEIKTIRLQSPMPQTPLRAHEKGRVSFMFQDIQRKEEATMQDGTRQDVGGPRRNRAGSFEVLESNSTEGDAMQSNQEHKISRVLETVQESVVAKLDVVDFAFQKHNSGQQLQEYVEPYLRNARHDQEQKNRYPNDQELARKVEFEGYTTLEERWQSQNQNGELRVENGFASVVDRSRVDSISNDVFPLPCRPLKHPKDSEGVHQDSPSGWKGSLEKTGLQSRAQGAANFIERDIEEALLREQELREQREAQEKQVFSPPTLVQQADKMAATQFYPQVRTDKVLARSSPRPAMRLSGIPLISPQPWSACHTPQINQTPQTPQPWSASHTPQTPWPGSPASHTPKTNQTPQTPQPWSASHTPQTPQPWSASHTPQTPQPWSVPHTPQTNQTPQTPQPSSASHTPQTPWPGSLASHTPQTNQTPQTPESWSASHMPQTNQTSKPWSASHTIQMPQTVVVRTAPLPVRGLTHTLLHNFEERRIKLKLEESAYAGIQPVDSVNNEVVESTRVTRHKNQRALQWEAGLFTNQQDL